MMQRLYVNCFIQSTFDKYEANFLVGSIFVCGIRFVQIKVLVSYGENKKGIWWQIFDKLCMGHFTKFIDM